MKEDNFYMKKSTCLRDCYDTCFFKTAFDGNTLSFEPSKEHPITQGFLCYKGSKMSSWALSSERLRTPLKQERKGSGKFVEITWDEALAEIKAEIDKVIKKYGSEKILVFEFAGSRGIINRFFPYRFFNKLNASFLKHNNCDSGGAEALKDTYGTPVGLSPMEVKDSNLIVYWGMNPLKTNLHGFNFFKRRGFEIWTVDVRESETAKSSNLIKIRPGTDIFLAVLVAKVLLENGWLDEDFVRRNSIGFDDFKAYISTYSKELLSEKCGVEIEKAKAFAKNLYEKKGIIHIGYGFQRSKEGPYAVSFISYLPFLVGKLPGFIYDMSIGLDKDYVKGEWLRSNEPKFFLQSQLADAIEQDEVKFVFIYNANPFTTNPNVNRLKSVAQEKDVFIVTHDLFLTDTALYSDMVLPAKSFFEYFDIADSYYHDFVSINEKVFDGLGYSNYELAKALSESFGFKDEELFESEESIASKVLKSAGLTLEELKEKGFVRVKRDFKLETPSGRVEFVSKRRQMRGMKDFPDLTKFPVNRDGEFRLLSVTFGNTITSQYHNIIKDADYRVYINPHDAERLGVEEGTPLCVYNDLGDVETVAHIDSSIPENCVLMYKAFWKQLGGFTVNELTSDEVLKEYGDQAVYHSSFVRIKRI